MGRSTRATVSVAGLISVALTLSGCSGGGQPADDSGQTAAGDGVFPVSIDTAYGEVTVDAEPERIVVLTSTYLEMLGYLDETAIASPEDEESIAAYSPWLEGIETGEVDPELVDADWAPAPEAIAAWEPDLILTDIWSTDEELYEQLSQIAPTYVGVEPDTQTDWDAHLEAITALTGNDPAVAEQVETDMAADFAAAAARLPGLQGESFIVPVYYVDNQFWPTEYGNEPIEALGMVPSEQQPHDGLTSEDVDTISQENIDRLTEDVVFIAASGAVDADVIDETMAGLEEDPRVAALPSAQHGTLVYLDLTQWVAINGGTPSSYRWWLDEVVPQLEASALNQSAL